MTSGEVELMEIKAVLIDIDNTILDFDKSAQAVIIKLAKDCNIKLPDRYFDVFRRINDNLWTELEQGNIVKSDIYKLRWKTIFKELDIEADYNLFEENFRKEMRNTAIPIEGAANILEYLSNKYPVYTASNSSKLQQEIRLRSSGLSKHISGMFSSEEIGFQKPAKEFFYECCKELYPIRPDETVMIGDSIDADIIGAKNFGIKSIWFDYYNRNYENLCFTDYRISELKELKNII